MDRNWTIHGEFLKLKEQFGLAATTELRFDASLSIEDYERAKGAYCHETKNIFLRSSRRTTYNLFVLLHEICHVIQFRDEVDVSPKTVGQVIRYEMEANDFAFKSYKEIYELELGPITPAVSVERHRQRIMRRWRKWKKFALTNG